MTPGRTLQPEDISLPDGNYLFYTRSKRDAPRYKSLMQVPSLGGESRERPGTGVSSADALSDGLLVVRGQDGANLLLGKTNADLIVGGAPTLAWSARRRWVGRTWHASALVRDGTVLTLAAFTWDPDPRAVRWSIYRQSLGAGLCDLDGDGLPDLGYGACAPDPDPTDNYFEDATMPPPGEGFMYAGTEWLVADGVVQEAGMGRTSAGLERPNLTPCP